MQDKSVTDDQELAKVLAGVSQKTDNNLAFEETGDTPQPVGVNITTNTAPAPRAASSPDDAAVAPAPAVAAAPTAPTDATDLDTIKHNALLALRPLVGKLNVSPEEKFDTYLLLLRSTDDRDLIAPAHEAATAIPDESRRAQALLDIIKEIDYLSAPKQ